MTPVMCQTSSFGVRLVGPARKLAKESGASRSAFCVRYARAARKCWSSARVSVTTQCRWTTSPDGDLTALLRDRHRLLADGRWRHAEPLGATHRACAECRRAGVEARE